MTITSSSRILAMNETRVRSRMPEPPYMWQNKDALRQIERTYDEPAITRLAIDAYNAASRMASDKESETFECHVNDIAKYMHCSHRYAVEGIKLAEAAGVLYVDRKKVPGTRENAPSTYALLHIDPPHSSGVMQNVHEVVQNVHEVMQDSFVSCCAETIEVTKEITENGSLNGSGNRPSLTPSAKMSLVDDQFISELKEIYQARDVDKAVAKHKAWLKTPQGQCKHFTKKRLLTFLRDAEPLSAAKAKKSGGLALTWPDSNMETKPNQEPISEEEQLKMAEEFARLRKTARV